MAVWEGNVSSIVNEAMVVQCWCWPFDVLNASCTVLRGWTYGLIGEVVPLGGCTKCREEDAMGLY